jgi:phage FluMu protein Com
MSGAHCECGALLARWVATGLELKCRRCKRILIIRFPDERRPPARLTALLTTGMARGRRAQSPEDGSAPAEPPDSGETWPTCIRKTPRRDLCDSPKASASRSTCAPAGP